jgi:hypothetical protein
VLLGAPIAHAQTRDSTSAGWVITDAKLPRDVRPSATGIDLVKGIAHVPSANFRDGTIEFDLTPPATAFAGIAFRMQSTADYEIIYFRPDSGRWVSVQYQPVYEGETTWQLYHDDGYQRDLRRGLTGPLHVKILIAGSRADVYVAGDTTPALVVRELKRQSAAGGIGFWVAGGADSTAANAGIHSLDVRFSSPKLAAASRETHPAEQLLRWRVSPRMSSASIETPVTMPASVADANAWKIVDAESSGLINLTRAIGNPAGPQRINVFGGAGWGIAFARTTITSAQAQTRRLYLSYSEGVGVYLNGARVFTGRNDYSLGAGNLGIVGPETEFVDLALRSGDNDVVLAITDNAFGWGFRARLDSLSGVALSAKIATAPGERR